MLLGVQKNYDIERDYLADETWLATKWRRLLAENSSLEEVNQNLKRQGVTDISYCPALFAYAAMTGIQGTGGMQLLTRVEKTDELRRLGDEHQLLRNWSTFTLYRAKFLETVYTDQDCQILKTK